MLSGSLTATQNNVAVTEGNENTAFYTNLGGGFNGIIRTISTQDDGRIIVGGDFSDLNGNTRNYLVRLNLDGTEDISFYSNLGSGFDAAVNTTAVQSDGKILVGGYFGLLNGNTRNYIVRLNDTEDTVFYENLGTGFNNYVYRIVIQSDGKILVGGNFTSLDGNTRNSLVRLNQDGTEDSTFYGNLGTGFNDAVEDIALQSDGKIVVVGGFSDLNGSTKNFIVRLNEDGTEDSDFYNNLGTGFNSGKAINVTIQPDGKILVGGDFNALNGITRKKLVRLYPDGLVDEDFYNNLGTSFDKAVYRTKVQPSGKILVGGAFRSLNGSTRNYIVQLNPDGTEDSAFYSALGIAFDSDVVTFNNDKILLVGGAFTDLNGNIRKGLVDLTHKITTLNNTSVTVSNAFNSTTGQFTIQGKTQILNTYKNDQPSGLEYAYPLPKSGVNGELAFWGGGTVTEGLLYFLDANFTWGLADASAAATSINMLAIAAGSGYAAQVGMLLRGHARFPGQASYTSVTSTGVPLFLSTTGGEFTETAPTGTGEIVRIIGYVQKSDNYQIYFCPDNTWVENI